MDTPFPQRVAIVTGAGRGLGQALVAALARPEHHLQVVLTSRHRADAETAARQLAADNGLGSAEGNIYPAELDVTSPASVFRLFADIEQRFGRLDVLVNNAAVAIDKGTPPSASDMEVVAATLDTNVLGVWRCCQRAISLMSRGGYGRITNVSSHMACSAASSSSSPAYAASKAALNHLTRALAAEAKAASENILINAASPGTVATRMNYGSPQYTAEQAAERMLWLSLLPDNGPTGQFFAGHDILPW